MRRILLILCLILALLVSCATGKTHVSEPEVETVVPTVVEEPAQAEEIPAVEEPAEETIIPEEAELIPEEEEQVVPEEQVTEEVIPAEEIAFEPTEEQDWSQVITAEAPEQEAEAEPAVVEEPVVEAPAVVEEEKPQAAAESEKPQAKTSAKKSDFTDKMTDLIKKVGAFVVKEKLLSVGLFVCFIGIIYLIVALIISARRSRREDDYYHEETSPILSLLPRMTSSSEAFWAIRNTYYISWNGPARVHFYCHSSGV